MPAHCSILTSPNRGSAAAGGLLAAALLGASALTGCAKPGVIFEPLASPVSWPGPPDSPRIHYVGQIATNADLKPGRSLGDALHETFFGKSPILGVVSPIAVECDDAPRLFVADGGGRVVHVFGLADRTYERWAPPEPDAFISPVGLARSADGRLFVADSGARVIRVFDARGALIDTWGQDDLVRPCGLARDDARGLLFIADSGAHQVIVLDDAGLPVARIGSRGAAPGSFNFPVDVALDHEGRLYVSDSLNCRIQQFVLETPWDRPGAAEERSLTYLPRLQIGSRGDMPGYFSRPKGIAVDSQDHLYVIDAQFEAVQVYSSDGVLLMAFGREGRGPGEFWLPSGIHIDPADRLWIADTYNRRIQAFDYRAPAPNSDEARASQEAAP